MPIGFIFHWSPVGNSPDLSTAAKVKAYFGYGTRTEITGRFLFGRSSSVAANKTGGSERVYLSEAHPPKVSGDIYAGSGGLPPTNGCGPFREGEGVFSVQENYLRKDGMPTETMAYPSGEATFYDRIFFNLGGGAAHENMPPYKAVYIWQRTA